MFWQYYGMSSPLVTFEGSVPFLSRPRDESFRSLTFDPTTSPSTGPSSQTLTITEFGTVTVILPCPFVSSTRLLSCLLVHYPSSYPLSVSTRVPGLDLALSSSFLTIPPVLPRETLCDISLCTPHPPPRPRRPDYEHSPQSQSQYPI